MQLMLAAFGRVLSLSANVDKAGDDPQLVCIGSPALELADEPGSEDCRHTGFCACRAR